MKRSAISRNIKFSAFSFSLLITLLLPLHITGQGTNSGNPVSPKSPNAKIAYKNYIWIEGENAVDTNFSKERTYNFFCSDRYALQLSKDADPVSEKGYYATYVFYVPNVKHYDLWMGCTPPGSVSADKPGYASPFDWKIDEGEFRTASSENTYVKEYYAPGSFYWIKIANGQLNAGKHTLTIRINQKRSSGWDYYFYIDAIILIPEFSGNLIPLMSFPEVSPSDYSDKKESITFEAEDDYRNRIKKNPRDRKSLFTLLQIYTWLYEYDKSISLCRDYLKIDPKDIDIRIILASSLAWSDRLEDSIKEYNNIISIDRNNITARKLLAVLAGWNNRYDEAIKNYQEIINIDGNNIDAYISLATQYSWKGEVNKALEIFMKAEAVAPDNIDVLYALGDNYNWSGKRYEAIQKFRRIIAINDKEINAYKKLAKIYLESDQKPAAAKILDDASRIISIYPELSGFSLNIESEMDIDNLATIDEYKNILKNNPDDLETRKNLIDSYIWNKMDDEANKEYYNLLNLKIVARMGETDEKTSALAVEAIKFNIAKPLIENLEKEIKSLNALYQKAGTDIEKGRPLDKEMNSARIKNDYVWIRDAVKKVDMLEQKLSRFNNIISYNDREIQTFLTQKTALKWEFNDKRIMNQAVNSEKNNPDDFRPKKVIGMIEYLHGDLNKAAEKLNFVFNKSAEKSFPVYPLSLAELKRYREAEDVITDAVKKKLLKGQLNENLNEITELINFLKSKPEPQEVTEETNALVKEINSTTEKTLSRIDELNTEMNDKLKTAKSSIQLLYDKMFLDLENDNVPVYNEIANYHLNRANEEVLDYYYRILDVQPLNVEINYKLGVQNEFLGFWKTAMGNYEICINNQPDNQLARGAHYELQKQYSPAVTDNFSQFSDKQITRMDNTLSGEYPLFNWMNLNAGYGFRKIDDNYSTAEPGQSGQIWATAKGSVMRHTGFAGILFNAIPLSTKIYFTLYFHAYSGIVDFENDLYDTDISYTSLNYAAGIFLPQPFKGMQLQVQYSLEDEAEQTQSLKLASRDAITVQSFMGILTLTLPEYLFPFSERISLYDSLEYKLLSDKNTRLSSFNQLSFRVLKLPAYGIDLDVSAMGSYEASKFVEYENTTGLTNIPYWAPDKMLSYGGGLSWKHRIDNIFRGSFSYELYFNYLMDSITTPIDKYSQTGYIPGAMIRQEWDRFNIYAGYKYSLSKASVSGAEAYSSQTIEAGVQAKFFSLYTPEGLEGSNIILVTASPNIITADGDGKDDFTTFTLTAYDDKGIKSWELEILNGKGEKIRSYSGNGNPLSTLKWDGTDKAFEPLPQDVYYYRLVITNTAGDQNTSRKDKIYLSTKTRAITPELSYQAFSPNNDGIKDKISIELKTTDKSRVESWNMFIMEKKPEEPKKKDPKEKEKERRIFRTISGAEFLPFDIEWDGRDNNGKILPDGEYYLAVNVKYEDRQEIISPEIPVYIVTKASVEIKSATQKLMPGGENLRINTVSEKEITSWKLSFFSPDDKMIKMIHGSGTLPGTITWNGTDNNNEVTGYNMPVTCRMEITDVAGNRGESNKITVWLDFLVEKQKDFTLITLFDQGIMHDRKKEEITPTGKEIVKQLADYLRKYKDSKKIRVVAHTSADGSSESNLELSKNLARNLGLMIKDTLNLETGVVNINGMGESVPYAKSNNRKWDARYEIEIF